jgi:DNA-binding IclR family transcriptional regulator
MTTQYLRALTEIQNGAATSAEVADLLGISRGNARVLVHDLLIRGWIRWTGNSRTRPRGQPGQTCRIYEAVPQ